MKEKKFFIAKKSFQIFPHLIDNNQQNKTLDFFNNIILFFVMIRNSYETVFFMNKSNENSFSIYTKQTRQEIFRQKPD